MGHFEKDDVAVKNANYNRITNFKFKQWEVRFVLKKHVLYLFLSFLNHVFYVTNNQWQKVGFSLGGARFKDNIKI